MRKPYYVIATNWRTGEEFDEGKFFSLEEACEHAKDCFDKLTDCDKEKQEIEVRQYAGDIEDENAPDDAFDFDMPYAIWHESGKTVERFTNGVIYREDR